MADFEQ